MGASSFELTINAKNDRDFAKLFREEAEQDRYENGNDPYRGTIGQKRGWRMLSSVPVGVAELRALKEKHEGDKWGDAMACPVAEEKQVGKTKTKTVKVTADSSWDVESAVKAKFPAYRVRITGRTKVREATYRLEKVEIQKGWRVVWGYNREEVFEKKGEAVKRYKALLLQGENASLQYKDSEFKRVLKRQAQWEVTVELKKFKETKKISHYAVWGWAAE